MGVAFRSIEQLTGYILAYPAGTSRMYVRAANRTD
jgi:hypothetical protein